MMHLWEVRLSSLQVQGIDEAGLPNPYQKEVGQLRPRDPRAREPGSACGAGATGVQATMAGLVQAARMHGPHTPMWRVWQAGGGHWLWRG